MLECNGSYPMYVLDSEEERCRPWYEHTNRLEYLVAVTLLPMVSVLVC